MNRWNDQIFGSLKTILVEPSFQSSFEAGEDCEKGFVVLIRKTRRVELCSCRKRFGLGRLKYICKLFDTVSALVSYLFVFLVFEFHDNGEQVKE